MISSPRWSVYMHETRNVILWHRSLWTDENCIYCIDDTIMYMYLFVLMFSIVVLIFECHLFACKRHEFPSWTNKIELNWIMPCVKSPSGNTIFAKCNGTWLSCGNYGVYVAVTGSTWLLRSLCPTLFRENRIEHQSVTSSKIFFSIFMIFFLHISVEHDEKPPHTKFDMNRFMVAQDMATWIPN